ncbi:MAG: GAF domain-containing protein [Candidatus Villigracilaceae bacterium]
MNKSHSPAFLDNLLRSLGGSYLLVIQALAQLFSFGAAAVRIYYILMNVEFTPEQTRQLIGSVFTSVVVANIIFLIYMYEVSPAARKRLYSWSKGKEEVENPELEVRAWQEVTRYPWRFGIAALVIATFGTILPSAAYMYYVGKATIDQAIHVAISGFLAAAIGISIIVILLEYGLTNARLVLLPRSPELQKAGLSGTRLQTRLAMLVMSSVGIALLITAPRAYQVAVDILNGKDVNLYTLRVQLIGVALVATLISSILTVAIARLIYRPLAHLVDVMASVEKGQIQRRADILGTDEIGMAGIQFNTMLERLENLQKHLDEEVQKRTRQLEKKTAQLQAAAQVAREAAAIRQVDELLNRVVHLISERFGFYHAGIFIADQAGQYVVLQTASSPGGQKMLERGHQLRIGTQGIVGTVAATQRSRIALDVGEDAVYFSNPDLPDTRSEMALPLTVHGRLIGVLDIQSTETRAFDQDDLVVLQTLADQIALAIENARLYTDSQQAIQQLQRAGAERVHTAWQAYTSRKKHAYVYTPLGTQALKEEITDTSGNAQNQIEVPIRLRGQKIGNIRLQRAGTELVWNEREQSIAQEIADQIGLAIENARLLEEQQRLAERERQMNIIATEIRKSTSTEKILQQTAREVGKALGAVRTFVQLGLRPQNSQVLDAEQPTTDRIAKSRRTDGDGKK